MGYTAVPNEIIEAQSKMSDPERRVTLALLRLTIGHQAIECTASYDTLKEMTGLSRGGVASGVSAVNARGFFERFGRSGWRFLVYTVDQNSLPDRLKATGESLPDRPKQSISKTNPVYPVDQNTPILKKKEKKEIYTPPNEITPFPEVEEKRQSMVSVLSGTAKEVYGHGTPTQDSYEQTADALIEQGVTEEQVRAFRSWWEKNGWYKGKPALKTVLTDIDNSIQGVTNEKTNGTDYRPLWNQVKAEMTKNGRRSTRQWNGQIAPVLKKAGGYIRLCSLSEFDAEQTFKSAYKDTT